MQFLRTKQVKRKLKLGLIKIDSDSFKVDSQDKQILRGIKREKWKNIKQE